MKALIPPKEYNLPIRNISLSRIQWTDNTYRITYYRPVEPLLRSIETIGLLQLPVLQEKQPGYFCVVSGFRRLQALQKLKSATVSCRVASSKTKPKELFLFNFYENLDRGFNTVELSWVVKKLSLYIHKNELIEKYLRLLNLPPRKEIIDRQIKINEMSPVFLPALVQGRLFPETVETVLKDFPSLAHFLLALFIFLSWGFQKQKELLSDLKTLRIRYREDPATLFMDSPVEEYLHLIHLTPQQKGGLLRKYFRARIFPILTETEKQFETVRTSLPVDTRTRILPPPYFEGGQYDLEVRFSNPKELKTSLEKIQQAIRQGKLDDLP